jgi:hypothetical protein
LRQTAAQAFQSTFQSTFGKSGHGAPH